MAKIVLALRHTTYYVSRKSVVKVYTPYEAIQLFSNLPKKITESFDLDIVFITQNGTPSYSQRYKPETQFRSSSLIKLNSFIRKVEDKLDKHYPSRSQSIAERLKFNSAIRAPCDLPRHTDLMLRDRNLCKPGKDPDSIINIRRTLQSMSIVERINRIDVYCRRLLKNGYTWDRRYQSRPDLAPLKSKDKVARKVATSYVRRFIRYLMSIGSTIPIFGEQ
jgi:hypothetical protein